MKTRFQKICQSGCVCSLKYLELIFDNEIIEAAEHEGKV